MLGAAVLVARSCGSTDADVSQARAIELARAEASFEPCTQPACVQVRYVPRGLPARRYWGVVLADELDEDGEPNRIESFLVDAESGEVSRP